MCTRSPSSHTHTIKTVTYTSYLTAAHKWENFETHTHTHRYMSYLTVAHRLGEFWTTGDQPYTSAFLLQPSGTLQDMNMPPLSPLGNDH